MVGMTLIKKEEYFRLKDFYDKNKPSMFDWNFSTPFYAGLNDGDAFEFCLVESHDTIMLGVYKESEGRSPPGNGFYIVTSEGKCFFEREINIFKWRKVKGSNL